MALIAAVNDGSTSPTAGGTTTMQFLGNVGSTTTVGAGSMTVLADARTTDLDNRTDKDVSRNIVERISL